MRNPDRFSVTLGALLSLSVMVVQAPTALAQNKHIIPLFISAPHQTLQGFARIINLSEHDGEVTIHAIDDAGERFGPVTLSLEAKATRHFNSNDLKDGNTEKGLSGGVGSGQGNWRLEFDTDLDIDPLIYTRRRGDGFVTSTHDVVVAEGESMRWRVSFFNPGSNTAQQSWLRVVNTSGIDTEVTVEGLDDNGTAGTGAVRFDLPADAGRMLSAQELEQGSADSTFDGRLGDGYNKWQLFVSADQPIQVMSLLLSEGGHLTNLSTRGEVPRGDDLLEADPSIARYLTGPVEQGKSPGLLAAIVDKNGVRAAAAAGVRKQGSTRALTVNDMLKINSNTKAMTSTMVATLVADGIFARGWETTIADVFPELLDEVHHGYHSIALRHLVTMTGGIVRNADRGYWNHQRYDVVENRYRILRDEMKNAPTGPVGEFLYSNLGYMVAGAMAERVTGKSWETLMEERLFNPLGMTTAGFRFQEGPDYGDDQPWGHWRDEDGESWVPVWLWRPPAWGPAATVLVSIEEWAKFIRLWFLNSDPAILDRDTLEELIGPVFGTTTDRGVYAAGWNVVDRTWAGGIVLFHTGESCCWATSLVVAPKRGVAYVAAANSFDGRSTRELLISIISHLISHDLSSTTGSDLVTRYDVPTSNWDAMTPHVPVGPGFVPRGDS